MKRLHDLKKSLPSNARLSNFERTRVKGGNGESEDKRNDRPSGGKGGGNDNDWGTGNGG